jgi:hypothetical protein
VIIGGEDSEGGPGLSKLLLKRSIHCASIIRTNNGEVSDDVRQADGSPAVDFNIDHLSTL